MKKQMLNTVVIIALMAAPAMGAEKATAAKDPKIDNFVKILKLSYLIAPIIAGHASGNIPETFGDNPEYPSSVKFDVWIADYNSK